MRAPAASVTSFWGKHRVIGIKSESKQLLSATHSIGRVGDQLRKVSGSKVDLEASENIAKSRTTEVYILCSTVGMLICLLLAACIRRRRRMQDDEVREAVREASRLAHEEKAISLKPKIMSFRVCVEGLVDGLCPICLESLASGQVCTGSCGHPVHEACLLQWVIKDDSMSCPVCRASFQVELRSEPEVVGKQNIPGAAVSTGSGSSAQEADGSVGIEEMDIRNEGELRGDCNYQSDSKTCPDESMVNLSIPDTSQFPKKENQHSSSSEIRLLTENSSIMATKHARQK